MRHESLHLTSLGSPLRLAGLFFFISPPACSLQRCREGSLFFHLFPARPFVRFARFARRHGYFCCASLSFFFFLGSLLPCSTPYPSILGPFERPPSLRRTRCRSTSAPLLRRRTQEKGPKLSFFFPHPLYTLCFSLSIFLLFFDPPSPHLCPHQLFLLFPPSK